MKSIKGYRLYFFTTTILLVLLIVTFSFISNLRHFNQDAEAMAANQTNFANYVLNREMQSIENIVSDMATPVEFFIRNGYLDSLSLLTRTIMENHPHLYSCWVVFGPDQFPEKGHFYSIGTDNIDSVLVSYNLPDGEFDFYQREWFTIPWTQKRKVWTDPYEEFLTAVKIITFGIPIKTAEDEVIGVMTVDVKVEWFTRRLDMTRLYENSKFYLINVNGEQILTNDPDNGTPDSSSNFIYKSPVGERGSIIITTIPKKDIYYDVMRRTISSVLLYVIVLILMGIIFYRLLKHNSSMQKEETERKLIDRELSIAHGIQMGMVPDRFPPFPDRNDIDIFAMMSPAKDIGGDFYDYIIHNEKFFFCIGDVSGKGVPASLLMATCRTMFRTLSLRESNPHEIVYSMNNEFKEIGGKNRFATLFVGVLDLPTGKMRYCNAGHCPPVLMTGDASGGCRQIDVKPNMPIGVKIHYSYQQQDIVLNAGETLFFYTDGITEAQDVSGKLFGTGRLLEILSGQDPTDPRSIIDGVEAAVGEWEKDSSHSDDKTMLAFRYTPEKEEVILSSSIDLENRKEEVERLGNFITAFAGQTGIDDKLRLKINLAVEEAVTNVIMYAYPIGEKGTVTIHAVETPGKYIFKITDRGKAFDPTARANVDLKRHNQDKREGGLGIYLIRRTMDTVNYEYADGCNVLTLTLKKKQ